ncbi:MAG TPA: sialate O-acetylesterase [Verrucomicrobiae bacterium]|nr:sialate O-acetylesterase [Verrucomicrobiae bacterium]
MKMRAWIFASVGLLFTFNAALADLRLHGLFTDNLILQRDEPVYIFGFCDNDDSVTVTFRNIQTKAKVKDGKWIAKLKPLKAGGPDNLWVTSYRNYRKGRPMPPPETNAIANVVVGEVWIASGQSNMEWPLRASENSEQAIGGAVQPRIRLYTVPKLKADRPTNDVNGSWQVCDPSTVPGFSAVAYYFARDLQKALNVPVGIIHTSWGGSPAEVWMSEDVLKRKEYDELWAYYKESNVKYQAAVEKFEQDEAAAKKAGKEFKTQRPRPPGWKPTELYNGMIAPLLDFRIKGAIWYQGESNAGRAWEYRRLFQDMIKNWRKDFDQGDFPFLEVQLAPFKAYKSGVDESDWAELREAQTLATKELKNVGMAVITDVGDEKDIHPKKKEPVGARLALAARAIAYGEKIEYSGPIYKSMDIRGNKIVCHFDHVGTGLEARGGELKGFAICGADHRWQWAKATIQGDKVVVTHFDIAEPIAVRYGWADFPVVNLWNKNGLPASPFRTDNFPMITQPKKPSS